MRTGGLPCPREARAFRSHRDSGFSRRNAERRAGLTSRLRHAPFGVSAKGAWVPAPGPCTFCLRGQRCGDYPAASVHLLGFRQKVHRTSLSESCTFRSLGQRCMDSRARVVHRLGFRPKVCGLLNRSRSPSAPGSEGVRVARLRPYTWWVFGQRCTDLWPG